VKPHIKRRIKEFIAIGTSWLAERRNLHLRFMRNTIFYTSLVVGIFLSNASFAQQSSGGTTVQPVAPRTGITPVTPNNASGSVMVQPSTANGTVSGAPGTSNQPGALTNAFRGSNNLAGTNGLLNGSNNVTAIVNPATNVQSGFNTNANVNGNVVIRDQAVTPSDRVLLTTLSQGVRATLSIVPNGAMPVHFLINNGTVTVVGTVQSAAQQQSVLSQVQQTPGVLSVVSDMHVASPYAPASRANQTGLLGTQTDTAFSAADKTLLTTVQQEAALQLGVTSTEQMPVHFSVQNGVVGVTGQVQSLQEKQALLASLARTRGITRVVDNVGIAPNSGAAQANTLTPTGNTNGSFNGSNTIFLNSTNSSGF
jgi:osmotically-inducible protein OsmY